MTSIRTNIVIKKSVNTDFKIFPRFSSNLPAIGYLGNCCHIYTICGFDSIDLTELKLEIEKIQNNLTKYSKTILCALNHRQNKIWEKPLKELNFKLLQETTNTSGNNIYLYSLILNKQ